MPQVEVITIPYTRDVVVAYSLARRLPRSAIFFYLLIMSHSPPPPPPPPRGAAPPGGPPLLLLLLLPGRNRNNTPRSPSCPRITIIDRARRTTASESGSPAFLFVH